MLKAIGGNALAIIMIQAVNFVFPLLALPHITRVLGLNDFGVYSIVLAYGNYVLLFSDFSFNVTGPNHVAQSMKSGNLRALIIDSTILKLMICLPSLIVYSVAISASTKAPLNVVLAGMAIPLTLTLTPRWIMYGLNSLYAFGAISLLAKLAWLVSVYFLVVDKTDLVDLLVYTAISQLLIALLSFVFIAKRAPDRPKPMMSRVLAIFRADFRQYTAIVSTSALRDLAVLMLSISVAPAAVSLYSLADRVRFAILSVVAPVSQSLYLFTARARAGIGEGIDQRVRGLTNRALVAVAFAAGLAICLAASTIVDVLGGRHFAAAAPLLRILSFVPTFTALSSILGVNTLLAQGFGDDYATAQLRSVAIGIPLMAALVWFGGLFGAATAALLVEMIGSLLLLIACTRRQLLASSFGMRASR